MGARKKPTEKTRDEQVRDLRNKLDAEIDQALHERADDLLVAAELDADVLLERAHDHLPIAHNGPNPSPEMARRLRRAAMYALLAASEIDREVSAKRKAGG